MTRTCKPTRRLCKIMYLHSASVLPTLTILHRTALSRCLTFKLMSLSHFNASHMCVPISPQSNRQTSDRTHNWSRALSTRSVEVRNASPKSLVVYIWLFTDSLSLGHSGWSIFGCALIDSCRAQWLVDIWLCTDPLSQGTAVVGLQRSRGGEW